MEQLIHADIFFFITSISVVIVTILVVIASVYVIRILRDVGDVSRRIKEEAEEIEEDIDALRMAVKTEGFKLRHLISFFFSLADRGKRRRKAKKK
jgi:hypothetical protein